ncbi:MAG: pyridoxamine 5'-phosphate oxidase family protein [Candidatus Omnitrophota bacterium]
MITIPREVVHFFGEQGCVILTSIDEKGRPHSSCKGIVKIDPAGMFYLLDLYRAATYSNINKDAKVSITAFNEHAFKGYCLKGKAKAVAAGKIEGSILRAWENRIASRITQRVVRDIKEEKIQPRHPEVSLPKPAYMIAITVEEIVDLTPRHLRGGE